MQEERKKERGTLRLVAQEIRDERKLWTKVLLNVVRYFGHIMCKQNGMEWVMV